MSLFFTTYIIAADATDVSITAIIICTVTIAVIVVAVSASTPNLLSLLLRM